VTLLPGDENGRSALLAIDTATSETIVALQPARGGPVVTDRWPAGHSHGERLLASVDQVLGRAGVRLDGVAAIAVGTGPGSFTGLRIGVAAAKGLAFGLGIPIVGIPTAEALARASVARAAQPADAIVVLQPAGPSGRYRTVVGHGDGTWRAGASELLTGTEPATIAATRTVAVDLADADPDAAEAGRRAVASLPETLIAMGRERLASAHGSDDLAQLVPVYVSPPRGAIATNGTIEWSLARP
jgi:tRNA threonylcarbamoyl adenosine modification protein YeaZ